MSTKILKFCVCNPEIITGYGAITETFYPPVSEPITIIYPPGITAKIRTDTKEIYTDNLRRHKRGKCTTCGLYFTKKM